MKLISLAASFRENGNNQMLVNIAADDARAAGADILALDYRAFEAPFYREDKPGEALPASLAPLVHALGEADGILLAMPEHNWSLPASLKNIIDWLSTLKQNPLAGKTALLMCASPSQRGGVVGLQQLRVPLELLGVWVYPQVVGVGNIYQTLSDGELTHVKDRAFLKQCVTDFVRATRALKG